MGKEKRNLLKNWKRCTVVILGIMLAVSQFSLPINAAEETGAETNAPSETVENVQALIDAHPSLEDVKVMNNDDRNAAYMECYKMNDSLTKLNGSEVKLTLEVVE